MLAYKLFFIILHRSNDLAFTESLIIWHRDGKQPTFTMRNRVNVILAKKRKLIIAQALACSNDRLVSPATMGLDRFQ